MKTRVCTTLVATAAMLLTLAGSASAYPWHWVHHHRVWVSARHYHHIVWRPVHWRRHHWHYRHRHW